jgi:hypothetical protein
MAAQKQKSSVEASEADQHVHGRADDRWLLCSQKIESFSTSEKLGLTL